MVHEIVCGSTVITDGVWNAMYRFVMVISLELVGSLVMIGMDKKSQMFCNDYDGVKNENDDNIYNPENHIVEGQALV